VAGGIALSALLSQACSGDGATGSTSTPPPSTSVVIGVAEGAGESDPEVGFQRIWPLFSDEGLTSLGSDGRPQPGIAESWEASPDGLTWRFTLKPDVVFHDGTPCNATAVKAILEAALKRPDVNLYPGLLDIRGLRAEGERTLFIDLSRPSAFLLEDLYIEIVKRTQDGGTTGTGPYYVVSRSSSEATLRAHARYSQGTPEIENVVFRSYPTLRQAWASLLRGDIDAVWNLSGDALEFMTDQTVATFNFQRHLAYVMVFNSQRPQLRSAAVRRALNAAVDRQALIQSVLKGRGQPAYSPVWPNHWASDASITGYTFDPSLAKTALDALIPPASRKGNSRRLRFTCIVPSDYAIFERLGLLLQTQLYNVGVDLQLESVPLSQFDARLRRGEFDAALFDLATAPSLSRVYLFWRSPGDYEGLNVFGYRNPEADSWLDRLRFAPDVTTTRAATGQLQRVLLEDPPALFLAWSQQSRAVSRRIDVGAAPGQDPFQTLWKWRIERNAQVARR